MAARKSAAYSVQRTCRSCLRDANDLLPLQRPSKDFEDWNLDSTARKTFGELMIECADIQV